MADGRSESMSIDTSTDPDEHLQDLTEAQLEQLLNDTIRANEVLATETQMFEKFLKRLEAKDPGMTAAILMPASQQKQGFGGSTATLSAHSDAGPPSRLSRRRSKSRGGGGSMLEKTQRLNAEQKCDIAQREIEEYTRETKQMNEDSQKLVDNLKAIMEESDIRFAEIKKETYEFDREIMKGAVNPKTGRPSAEKVIKYLEDRLRARETLTVKLRLKNAALKTQKKKMQMQLRQKEEMGEVLHEVDFQQLQIENKQYIEKIDERNQDLLRLKLMAGQTLTVLNMYKKKLGQMILESESLKEDIGSRDSLLKRIDDETEQVEQERAIAERLNRDLRTQLGDYRVPDVLDYVQKKSEIYDLQKKVKSWERKVEIADMALKNNRKTWGKIQASGAPWLPPAMMN